MKIYVVRHGLTEFNKREILNGEIDEPLSAEGIEQAKQVAALLPRGITHVYVSSLLRTKQTAEIINAELNLPVSFHDELNEVHVGHLAGRSWADMESGEELKQKHRSVQYDYRPEGECAEDVKRRVSAFLRRIQKMHDQEKVLIVTHGGIVRILQLFESGLPRLPANQIKNASMYIFDLEKILNNAA